MAQDEEVPAQHRAGQVKWPAYVIVWSNPATGLDEFYAGYEAAEPPCRFKGLGSAVLFPDEDPADRSLEQLMFDVPAAMRAALSVKPVTITYHGKAKP